MWNTAKNAIRMISTGIIGYEVIGLLTKPTDNPKGSLQGIAAVVTAMIEGFHGRIPVDRLEAALLVYKADVLDNYGVNSNIIEKFRSSL